MASEADTGHFVTARKLAHHVLRAMRLPCGFVAEAYDEGGGWTRMPTPHALDCERATEVIAHFLASAASSEAKP